MGQILNSIDSRLSEGVLRTPVQPQCGVLTGCRSQLGTLIEIRRLYERYRRHSSASGHYLALPLFRSITRNSPLEGFADATRSFERGSERSLNILELTCALVLFAATGWESKATYLMRMFDFDGNKCLSHEEVTILCSQAVNGFASMTGTPRLLSAQLATLSDQVFSEADSTPDGLVTYDEVKQWIRLTPDLFQLLSSAPDEAEPDLVFLFMHDSVQSDPPKATHRKNPSIDLARVKPMASSRSRLPRHVRSNSDAPVAAPTAISVRGSLVTKEEVLGMKQAFNLLKKGRSLDEIKAGMLTSADKRRVAEAITSKNTTFEEVLVHVFKGVSQKDLKVLVQWASELRESTPKVAAESSLNSMSQYQYLFDIYDTNKNGELSLLELKSALSHMFSYRDIEQMFLQYDENHDDRISLLEFMKMMAPDGKEVAPASESTNR